MAAPNLNTFLYSQLLIWGPLALGHQVRRRAWLAQHWARTLQAFNYYYITPLVLALGIWKLNTTQGHWAAVLVLETLQLTLFSLVGVWLAPRLTPSRAAAGTLAIMVPLSNTGHTMAGFLTIFFLSGSAYAYNALINIPVTLFIGLVWMPLAQHWSARSGNSFARTLARSLVSVQIFPLLGVAAGFAMKTTPWQMTPALTRLMTTLVIGSTALNMFAIGLRLHLRHTRGYQPVLKWVYLGKFFIMPLVMLAVCMLIGLTGPAAGALVIANCVPVGVMVIGIATIFNLDIDLANAGMLWSTLFFMLLVLPLLVLLLRLPIFH
jgi:predicted permease